MKKAEMEAHQQKYHANIRKARGAKRKGSFQEAIEFSKLSWDHIDGMMRYERKYEDKAFKSIEGIDIVLKHAPYLFDFQSLDDLEALLRSQKRIEKNTSLNLNNTLEAARKVMWDAHRVWSQLERAGELQKEKLLQILGGDNDNWQSMAESWYEMGLIRRWSEDDSYRIALVTRMDEATTGKCPSCGVLAKAPKSAFLITQTCPKCKVNGSFVILTNEAVSESKE